MMFRSLRNQIRNRLLDAIADQIKLPCVVDLQARVRFELAESGRWSFTLHKEPFEELIKPPLSKLIPFLDR